ncbi:Replication factor C subunit 2 [Aphelenchoides fujianensis]|nr:Replication factor C subunit 2 [Aphelenchoides fujianensis]
MAESPTPMEVDGEVNTISAAKDEVRKERRANMPWLEKYRPRTLDEMAGNAETVKRFKYFVVHGNIPHLILSSTVQGPPGVGKTSTIHAMAREALAGDFKKAVLELNASDDRGLDVFSRLADKEVYKRVVEICKMESVEYVKEGIDAIVGTAQGDMRQASGSCMRRSFLLPVQAINNLQCTATGYGSVTADNVYKVCDEPHPNDVNLFFENCTHGQFKKANAFLEQQRTDGHAFTDILAVLNRVLITADIPEAVKYEFVKIVGVTHMEALKGHDGRLQMAALTAQLCTVHTRLLE